MVKIALAVIAKNEEKNIGRMIESVRESVDLIALVDTGSADKTIEVAKEAAGDVPIFVGEDEFLQPELGGAFNFAEARHSSFELAKKHGADWILWLDCDDTLENAELLRSKVGAAHEAGRNSIHMFYKYRVDEAGNLVSGHWKQRVLKADEVEWEWMYNRDRGIRYPIHENVYTLGDERYERETDIFVLHHASEELDKAKKTRNLEILIALSEFEGDNPDPRTTFLLGRQLFSLNRFTEAERYLRSYLRGSVSPTDRFWAIYYLWFLYRELGDWDQALNWGIMAVRYNPELFYSWWLPGIIYTLRGDYEHALTYLNKAEELSQQLIETEVDFSLESTFIDELHSAKSDCLIQIGNKVGDAAIIKQGIGEAQKALPYTKARDLGMKKSEIDRYKGLVAMHETLDSWFKVFDTNFAASKTTEERRQLYEESKKLLPETIRKFNPPRWTAIRRKLGDYQHNVKPHVTIYCPGVFEEWDPEKIITQGGGGSETAVVEQARRFAKAGYGVTVYAWPIGKKEKEYEGVLYKYKGDIDWADRFDIFISWRAIFCFQDKDIWANKKYVWLQDIMSPYDYTTDVINQLDKIIVLSKYHRHWLPAVPEDKFFYTTNGIDIGLIEEVEATKPKRNPKKVFYASSADRGLEPLVYKIWPKIRELVPDAELYWAYGWNSTLGMTDPESDQGKDIRRWIDEMDGQMEKMGVHNLGRIGKKELYAHMFESGVWAYPLQGPAETSCIVAMEMQACGAYPVTTGITALEETQQYGYKIPREHYTEALVAALKGDKFSGGKTHKQYQKEMMKWARETYNWDRVADEWIEQLFYGHIQRDS